MSKREIILCKGDLSSDIYLEGDVAIDTEAMGLDLRRDRLCLVQICDAKGPAYLIQVDSVVDMPNLKKLLEDDSRRKLFHFARFDVALLMKSLNLSKINNVFCTKITSKLVRTYSEHHSLKALVGELLHVELRKDQQSSNWGAKELSVAQKNYAANDVIYLHALFDKLHQMLIDQNKIQLAQYFFDALHPVCCADIIGFNGDQILQH